MKYNKAKSQSKYNFNWIKSLTKVFFILLIDGSGALSILPLAALLTGALLTIGIAVLLVVVLAIRKRRDPLNRSSCDGKDKHMGEIIHIFLKVLQKTK